MIARWMPLRLPADRELPGPQPGKGGQVGRFFGRMLALVLLLLVLLLVLVLSVLSVLVGCFYVGRWHGSSRGVRVRVREGKVR
jgi:hypothetical protein